MVAIKEMIMPRCCGNCALVRYDALGYSCKKRGVEILQDNVLHKRADDCPLVEIEERKVGKWIDYWGDKTEPDGETWWSGCKCSVCGIFIKSHYNYCPKCGAEMRGSENDI